MVYFGHQWYPVGRLLAHRAICKFKNKRINRLLEPSAGQGDFIEALQENQNFLWDGGNAKTDIIDCVELEPTHCAVLKDKGYRIIGHDFLELTAGAMYTHILMNPPFSEGAEHVLHAWNLLTDGELVAIVNAETLRNPCDKYRLQLVRMIEDQQGSVEFVQDGFLTADTQRKTGVEVAIIHLTKTSDFKLNFIEGLEVDHGRGATPSDFIKPQNLILPENKIENLVHNFNLAVEKMAVALQKRAEADYYKDLLGLSLTATVEEAEEQRNRLLGGVSILKEYNKQYVQLRSAAWSNVLNSVDVMNRLSSKAQNRLHAEFDHISRMSFTVKNVYGFLCGLVDQQENIQIEMLCDVFDLISKYHPDNRAYYQGWKSNAKHRTHAFRLKTTRFILPTQSSMGYGYGGSAAYQDLAMLGDIDKVFRLMDGKPVVETGGGLKELFNACFNTFKSGERLESDYFEMRFYVGKGTFHIYPKRKDLMDRLNRTVGAYRNWLPHDKTQASPEFWQQFEAAEAVTRHMDLTGYSDWKMRSGDEFEQNGSYEVWLKAHQQALQVQGVDYSAENELTWVVQQEVMQNRLENRTN